MGIKTRIGDSILEATRLLKNGELVAIPTETVYGLAANGLNSKACTEIFEVKNRPFFDPLILHIGNLNQLNDLVKEIPHEYESLIKKFWPGPLTLVFNKSDIVPDIVCSGGNTVAIRMPSHPLTLELLQSINFPLAAPSANPFKYVSPTNPMHVMDQLNGKIPYILDGGNCEVGLESTIINSDNGALTVLRVGGISVESLREFNSNVKISIKPQDNPIAPGQLEHHYSPNCKLKIIETIFELSESFDAILTVIPFERPVNKNLLQEVIVLSKSGDLTEAAQNLFKELRNVDSLGYSNVAILLGPEVGLGRAINDRLTRAASSKD